MKKNDRTTGIRKYSTILFSLFVILISLNTFAQQNIFLQLQQPPPYQFKIEDMWKVNITNTSQTNVRVYLYGTAWNPKDGFIVDGTTNFFNVPPGVKYVLASEIGPIKVNKQNQVYGDVVKKIGGVPTGQYQICVYAKDAVTNEILAFDCIDHEVQNFTEVELLSPFNNSVFANSYFEIQDENVKLKPTKSDQIPVLKPDDKQFGNLDKYTIKKIKNSENIFVGEGQFIVFNWMPPTPVPYGYTLRYKLDIVEAFSRQTAYDAMKTNPMFYTNSRINTSTFQYPLSASPLKHGFSYAWQVTAYVNNVEISKSEIWEFTYLNFAGVLTSSEELKNENISLKKDYFFSVPENYQKNLLKELREERISAGENKSDYLASKKIFDFKLNSKIYGEHNSNRPPGNELPKNIGNLDLTPTLSIYGIPFSVPLFFSSQGSPDRQRINTFAFLFDKEQWKKKIEDMIKVEKDKITQKIENEKNKLEQKILQEKDKLVKKFEDEKEKIKGMAESERAKLESELMQEKNKLEKQLYDEKEKLESKLTSDKDKQIENIKDGKSLLTGALKWVNYIKSLGFGTTYPEYTKYTVTGISSTGYDIELNPGILYLATSGFRSQKAITNESFLRNLFAGRLGIGEKEYSHLIFTYMYATDDENSMSVDTAVSKTLFPQSNHIFGAEGKLSFLDSRLTFEAEGNASLFTRDVTAASIESEDIPQFVMNMFNPKISSNIDYMYTFRAGFNNEPSDTKILASMIMLGPGYYSLGAPTLRNDKMGFEAKIDQKFFERQLSFSVNFKRSKDNLISSKSSTTTLTSFGINFGLNFRKYPYLRVMYMPYFQTNDKEITTTDSNKIDNKTHILNIMTGYSKNFGDIFTQTNIMFSLQNTETLFGLYDAKTNSLMLTQSFGFRFPLTLSASVGLINSSYKGSEDSRLINFDLSLGYTFFEVWQNSFGVTINTDKSKNDKYGFFLNSSATLWNILSLDLRADYNAYREFIVNALNYNKASVRATVTLNF